MNWDMISAIIGIASLLLALCVEIIKLFGLIQGKANSESKPPVGFLYSGATSIFIGIITIFGLSLFTFVTWFWVDGFYGVFLIPSFFAVLIGLSLIIIGTTTSIMSIKNGNRTAGYIGLTLNAIGCLPLAVMVLIFILLLLVSLNLIKTI